MINPPSSFISVPQGVFLGIFHSFKKLPQLVFVQLKLRACRVRGVLSHGLAKVTLFSAVLVNLLLFISGNAVSYCHWLSYSYIRAYTASTWASQACHFSPLISMVSVFSVLYLWLPKMWYRLIFKPGPGPSTFTA